jgi:hypothetical protein
MQDEDGAVIVVALDGIRDPFGRAAESIADAARGRGAQELHAGIDVVFS